MYIEFFLRLSELMLDPDFRMALYSGELNNAVAYCEEQGIKISF